MSQTKLKSAKNITKNSNSTKKNKNSKSNQSNSQVKSMAKGSSGSSSQNLSQQISEMFDQDNKVEQLKINIGDESVTLFYIDSLIDKALFAGGILSQLEKLSSEQSSNASSQGSQISKSKSKNKSSNNSSGSNQSQSQTLLEKIKLQTVSISGVVEAQDVNECLKNIFSGFVVLVVGEGAICYPIFGVEKRGIQEPPTSRVVKGPREGFVEDIGTNLGLVRKRLKTNKLKIIDIFVGEKTDTQVSLVYLEGVAKKEIIADVKKRIKNINIDAIIDSYYIESYLEEDRIKFFRRVGNTEKPDVFCAKVLEGRIGILVDGSPISLTVPFVLFEDLQSSGDYYSVPAMATFARLMRIFGLITAILAPGIYVSLQSYNYRILPINFLIALLSSIEGLSIPPLIEILVVLLLFEIITEASLQMPSALGMALSIIGALALGSTAVDAGLLSAPSIVIVAISSVALYIIPDQISETRLLRLLMTVVGGVIGLYGIVTAFMILTTYLTSMTSFGIPYMSPLAPSIKSDKKDAFVKQPVQSMDTRPELIAAEDKVRQQSSSSDNDDMSVTNEQNDSTDQNESEKNKASNMKKSGAVNQKSSKKQNSTGKAKSAKEVTNDV